MYKCEGGKTLILILIAIAFCPVLHAFCACHMNLEMFKMLDIWNQKLLLALSCFQNQKNQNRGHVTRLA